MRCSSEHGQSTVEAAMLLPILFVVIGMLIQPALLLYNRCIMNAAACEGCRLIATNTNDDATTRAFMQRRLGAIPMLGIFHEGEQWEVSWSGGELGQPVSVTIVNHVRPLPLFGVTAALSNTMTPEGFIEQRVEANSALAPAWASALGSSPSSWIGEWK
jgi:Flp pilus assembly protein TadG